MTTEDEVEDFLAHYGVKGMKWGVRKKRSSTGQTNRQLNKASRRKDTEALDRRIDEARARTTGTSILSKIGIGDKGSKSQTEYKKAREDYKKQKVEIGSREAKKVLNEAKAKRTSDIVLSNTAKSGSETVFALLGLNGRVAVNFRGNQYFLYE